jgi:hypothetical protein
MTGLGVARQGNVLLFAADGNRHSLRGAFNFLFWKFATQFYPLRLKGKNRGGGN